MLVPTQRAPAPQRSTAVAKSRDGAREPAIRDAGEDLVERIAAAVVAAQGSADASDEAAALQQRLQFDTVLRQRAELDRELNALRELSLEQVKRDDEVLKKWIALI